MPDIYSDSRSHGYQGPTRHVRLPRATTSGGGAIAKSEDGVRCVVAGREALRIIRLSEPSSSGSSTPTEHKSVIGRGGHRIEASRNFWDGSGLKVDSASTDVAWGHGLFNHKILTSARNGELIMWDLNKAGPSKYERRTRDHARSIHALSYSPILQNYCMTGSADGDLRVWDLRDISKSIMKIHHPASVRAVVFSPSASQSRHCMVALDNGSMYRWDLNMAQRGQLDRIPVAHSGPILSLDWMLPASSPSMVSSPPARFTGPSNWYGGSSGGLLEDFLPMVSSGSVAGASAGDGDGLGAGWVVSGGLDRCVKVWDLSKPSSKSHISHRPTYTLRTSFPVRRVLWRPGYECELAVVSNADFGTGTDMAHGVAGPGSPSSASVGIPSGLVTAMSSPRLSNIVLGNETPTYTDERAKSVTRNDGSDPVEIWDVRRGYIAKWVVSGSAVEGGVTDIAFGDSHAIWTVHSSGTFSQLDLRQSRKPLDAISRTALSWSSAGSLAFAAGLPKRWEVPYDDVNPEKVQDKQRTSKALGDLSYRPVTQNVGTFAPDGAADDLGILAKLAQGYIYEGASKRDICIHNAKMAIDAGNQEAAQTWLLVESLLTDLIAVAPPTPPLSPLPFVNPGLPHSASAPAAIPTVHSLQSSQAPAPRSISVGVSTPSKKKDDSPGARSKLSDDRPGYQSPRRGTPTSSTKSSPRRSVHALPPLSAAILPRRESNTGSIRPKLSSASRRMSFTASLYSGHSETTIDIPRVSARDAGEGALSDSDSEPSDGEHGDSGGDDSKSVTDREDSSSRTPISPYLYPRNATAHPSPLSRVAGKQTCSEDEEDDDSPSPASTSDSDSSALSPKYKSTKVSRRNSTRSKTRSRSSTVASLAIVPSRRTLVKQDSQSSIRTVTPSSTPILETRYGSNLRRDDTIREIPGGRPESVKASSLHRRGCSDALSGDFALDSDRHADENVPPTQSVSRGSNDAAKALVREAEMRFRELGWEALRERFETFADEGDVQMCALLSLVVPDELRIQRSRVTRFLEAYIDVLWRLRLHTAAAYMRKFVEAEEIRATTALQTTIYTTCRRCRKPIQLPVTGIFHAGRPSGSYAYCLACKDNITRCSICHLPVRALMFQCPICMHGGHQECYPWKRMPI
ncbi:WD repeat-containing protein 24 [Grifola frondosa]|uniref:WD repeat-containing protein 24 n=1 Tax=Grifola frondosa TaxID=5627 RepID=A0A1C7LMN9_GRIFR|nr:WD repeat-containing protein 24 [Grifola frondosa]